MKNFTVEVPGTGFELSSNQIYHIREISDADAPDGYQREGISKHPLPGIAESIVPPHDGVSWNTGFNIQSACYRGFAKSKEVFKTISENLLPEISPLVSGDLEEIKSSNNELFDDFPPFSGAFGEDTSAYKVKGGNMFNTTNPLEFLALWWALLGRQVMPLNKKNDPKYKNCSFVLEDRQQSTTKSQDNEFSKAIAISTVIPILNNKKNKKEITHLQNVFTYVGLNVELADTEVKPVVALFSQWCDKGGFNSENAVEFNDVMENYSSTEKREELVVYSKLVEDIKTSKITVERRDIFLDGINLGADKKVAARRIVSDKDLHKKFLLI